MAGDDNEETFTQAARKLLFRKPTVFEPAEERTSAAAGAERHLRVKVTMNLDGDVIAHFKKLSKNTGRPYQVLINEALRSTLDGERSGQILDALKSSLLNDETFLIELEQRIASDKSRTQK